MKYRDFRKVFSVFLLGNDNLSIQSVLGSLNFVYWLFNCLFRLQMLLNHPSNVMVVLGVMEP